MGLIRLITYALLIWIVWTMIRNWLAKQQQKSDSAAQARKAVPKVVKCRYCDLHLPEEEALTNEAGTFCSKSHQQAWLEKHP